MPITNYDTFTDTAFEGQLLVSTQTRVFAVQFEVFSDAENINNPPAPYPTFTPYGRVLTVTSRIDNQVGVAPVNRLVNNGLIGFTPATTIRKRQFVTPSSFNQTTGKFELESGVRQRVRMTVARSGVMWVWCEDTCSVNLPLFVRYDLSTSQSENYGVFKQIIAPSEANEFVSCPYVSVIRGQSNPTGGLILIEFEFPSQLPVVP